MRFGGYVEERDKQKDLVRTSVISSRITIMNNQGIMSLNTKDTWNISS